MKHRAAIAAMLTAAMFTTVNIASPQIATAGEAREASALVAGRTTEKDSEKSAAPPDSQVFAGGQQVLASDPPVGAAVGPADSVIGSIDTNTSPPEGISLSAGHRTNNNSSLVALPAPTALSGGYGCMISCIEEGLAYARGFGAELVVNTSVPTTVFFGVIELSPGFPLVATTTLNSMDTEHSWPLDDLEPGHTYGVTVSATDGDGNADMGYGEFTTLSTRTVSVELGDVSITGGPSSIEYTHLYLGVSDEDLFQVTPGDATPAYQHSSRFADLSLLVRRKFDAGGCEAFAGVNGGYDLPDQGHSVDACMVWNTAWEHDVDLDVAPAGATRWNATSFTRQLHTPDGAGWALPDGFGDDWWLYVSATATVEVTYS